LVALAVLLPLVTVALAALIQYWLDGKVTPTPGKGHLLMVGVNVVLIFLIGGPLGEEFGWRGYAQRILQQTYDWRIVSLGIGVIWGIWHVPLFLMPQTQQSALPFSLFFASALGLSVISGWLYNRANSSLIPVMIFHTALNASPMLVATTKDLRIYGISVGLMSVVAVVLLFAKTAIRNPEIKFPHEILKP
jgi:membrane protease YdiL (CAAX protease family)